MPVLMILRVALVKPANRVGCQQFARSGPLFSLAARLVGGALIAISCVTAVHAVRAEETPQLPPAAKRKVDFKTDVEPLLRKRCHECHGASKQEAGLRFDRRDDALNGGDSGPAFVSGKSSDSRLIKYVAAVDPDVVMPPKGDRLSDEQIGLLRGWIDQGLNWPDD